MENISDEKLELFLKTKKQKKEYVKEKNGLFERHEIINKKIYTHDGRQLLKETLFED